MPPIPVDLTLEDCWRAVACARERQTESAKSGRNHATTYDRDFLKRLEEEVVGACGELAFASLIGESWGAVNTFHRIGDVAGMEVRSTALDHGRLTLRVREIRESPALLDRIFVLVSGRPPHVRVVGWLYGREIVRDEWLDDPHDYGKPAYWAPQSELHDPELLVSWWIEERRPGA